ncbi:MAG: hypothetical protein JW714_01050 [Candidatus Omnitrophica bacterium]|nr:hypothetical protein [Candidatus Omnitrophota bacterium]
MLSLLNRKGQSTAEHAIVIALVIAAALAMQTYVKRGMQGRVASASDRFTARIRDAEWSSVFGTGQTGPAAGLQWQWEPDQLNSYSTRIVIGGDDGTKTEETMSKGGQVTRDITEKTNQAAGDYRQYDY